MSKHQEIMSCDLTITKKKDGERDIIAHVCNHVIISSSVAELYLVTLNVNFTQFRSTPNGVQMRTALSGQKGSWFGRP